MSSIPKNWQILLCARKVHAQQNFNFQKITGTLKINNFFKVGMNLFLTSKTNCQKIEFKIKGCSVPVFFLFFKVVANFKKLLSTGTAFKKTYQDLVRSCQESC